MAFQLRFADATLDADLLDGGSHTLVLEPTVRYALCRTMTVRPEGCMPLVVRDPKVSACHFILSFLDGRWRVEDGNGSKRSTNGTLLDGVQINTLLPLTPGSVITAQRSKTSLYFEAAPEAAAAAEEAAATQTFSQEAADSTSASRCGSAIEAAAVERDAAVEQAAAVEAAAVDAAVVEAAAVEEVACVEVPGGGGGTASQPEHLEAVAPPPPVGSKLT
eukprot:scaffold12322_cov58-Phaeocystis_antarctica.AAC.1